jgi:hypothetical protein
MLRTASDEVRIAETQNRRQVEPGEQGPHGRADCVQGIEQARSAAELAGVADQELGHHRQGSTHEEGGEEEHSRREQKLDRQKGHRPLAEQTEERCVEPVIDVEQEEVEQGRCRNPQFEPCVDPQGIGDAKGPPAPDEPTG